MEKVLMKCACGCGEDCGDNDYQWIEVDGQAFATWECWEKYEKAAISHIWGIVLFIEDGKQMKLDEFYREYEVQVHG